jgi:uncharacterized membrane protein
MMALVGILVMVVGLVLRWNTLLVVVLAGFATGLGAGFSVREILGMVGSLFVENRFMSLPIVLLLPAIGLLERFGLQERAAGLIAGISRATAGRVMWVYQALRQAGSMVGLTIGGHAAMVRPLVAPMAEALAQTGRAPLPRELSHRIRAHAAAAENWGNFFADDILVAIGPVLLMKGVLESAGVSVSVVELGLWGLPTAVMALVLAAWRYRLLDRDIARWRASGPSTESRAREGPIP